MTSFSNRDFNDRRCPKALSIIALLVLFCVSNRDANAADCTHPAVVTKLEGEAIVYDGTERRPLKVSDTICDEHRVFLAEGTIVDMHTSGGSDFQLFTPPRKSLFLLSISLAVAVLLFLLSVLSARNFKNNLSKLLIQFSSLPITLYVLFNNIEYIRTHFFVSRFISDKFLSMLDDIIK